jgi:hypothetical protein
MNDDDLLAMRETYEKAMLEYLPHLPAWDKLSPEMRATFIRIFYAGRSYEAQAQVEQRKRIEGR